MFIERSLRPFVLIAKGFMILMGLLIFIRLFIADLYFVPTSSMENAIEAGSYVTVSKFQYGARLPKTTAEIPILSAVFKMFRPFKLWSNHRLPGTNNVSSGDVVLVDFIDSKIIKRVVAGPGDTIVIKNGLVTVNSIHEELLPTFMLDLIVRVKSDKLDSLKRYSVGRYLGDETYEIRVSGENLQDLERCCTDESFLAATYPGDTSAANGIVPRVMRKKNWDRNNYGPFVVPYTGMKIHLDSLQLMYLEVIEKYETEVSNAKAPIMREAKSYIFKNDYYFLMGDNRMQSFDSRFLGVVPKKNVLGKVIL